MPLTETILSPDWRPAVEAVELAATLVMTAGVSR